MNDIFTKRFDSAKKKEENNDKINDYSWMS